MKKNLFLSLLACVFFSGCDGIEGKLLVMKANMQVSQIQKSHLQYTNAIAAYSEALRFPEAAPYAEYGLGVVYLFLSENDAALTRFNNAEEMMNSESIKNDEELDFRIHYNQGILHFHAGHFDEAAAAFRKALEIDADRIEAKRNLELSLLFREQQNSASGSSSAEMKNDQGKDNALFDYLRQKEAESWKTPESSEDQDFPWLDY